MAKELGEPVQLTFDLLAKFVKAFVPIVRDASKVRPCSWFCYCYCRIDGSFGTNTASTSISMLSALNCQRSKTYAPSSGGTRQRARLGRNLQASFVSCCARVDLQCMSSYRFIPLCEVNPRLGCTAMVIPILAGCLSVANRPHHTCTPRARRYPHRKALPRLGRQPRQESTDCRMKMGPRLSGTEEGGVLAGQI